MKKYLVTALVSTVVLTGDDAQPEGVKKTAIDYLLSKGVGYTSTVAVRALEEAHASNEMWLEIEAKPLL